ADTLSEVLANGNTTGGTNILFGDSSGASDDRLVFGAGSDLQIYHDGSNSYVKDSGTGDLMLQGVNVRIQGATTGNNMFVGVDNGASTLYHQNNAKLATTSTGIDVTGTVTADGLTVDGGTNLLTRTSSGAEVDVLEVRNNATATSTASTIKFVNSTAAGSNSGSSELVAVRTGTNTGDFKIRTSNSTGSMIDRLLVDSGGDVNIYGTANRPLAITSFDTVSTGAGWDLDATSISGVVTVSTGGTERMRIDSSGNVGIGTSSPSQELHLRQSSGDCNLLIDSANGASQIFFGDDESVNIGNIRYDHASNYMRFSTNSAERMRIDSSGRVGIGTTSPSSELHVNDASGAAQVKITAGGTSQAQLSMTAGGGTESGIF
ncbi:MAG: hypothetical protein VXY99_12465, partial [Pseudomonadota bacterium]|nr:hypothetical protein [Pseudomonadota bacterium]